MVVCVCARFRVVSSENGEGTNKKRKGGRRPACAGCGCVVVARWRLWETSTSTSLPPSPRSRHRVLTEKVGIKRKKVRRRTCAVFGCIIWTNKRAHGPPFAGGSGSPLAHLARCASQWGKNYKIEKKKDNECTYLDQKREGVPGARVWGTVYGSSSRQRPWVGSHSRAGPGCRLGGLSHRVVVTAQGQAIRKKGDAVPYLCPLASPGARRCGHESTVELPKHKKVAP